MAPAPKVFIDSNVLIYSDDVDELQKHPIARSLLTDLFRGRSGVLRPQVLQEFYVVITRKITSPLTRSAARQVVEDWKFLCIDITANEVASAFRIEDEAKVSFWDALICASALKAGAQVILSEDMNHGQNIRRHSHRKSIADGPTLAQGCEKRRLFIRLLAASGQPPFSPP